MQTGETAGRITTASHNLGRQIVQTAGLIVVEDGRLRGWSAAETGGMVQPSSPNWLSGSAIYPGGALTSGTAYYYTVCGQTGLRQSTASPVIEIKPTSSASASLVWSGVTAVTGWEWYLIYRSLTANNFLGSALVASSTATSYIDGGA